MDEIIPEAGRPEADPESAVIVLVPHADRALAGLRRRLDRAGGLRVPAHVTVIYPFVPPGEIDSVVEASLARAVASVPAFGATFERIGWFGDEVLFVEPEPAEAFRRLTRAVWDAFPGHPPYRGVHPDPVPHLTVGAGVPVDALRAVVPEVEAALPLACRVDHAVLVEGTGDELWAVRSTLALG